MSDFFYLIFVYFRNYTIFAIQNLINMKQKQDMSIPEETLKFWNESRYWRCVNDLAEHLNVTHRTINNALNHNYCTKKNQELITNFFKNRL